MKHNEFKRWLQARGVEFIAGKGRHRWKLRYHGRMSVFSDHGSKEMKEPTRLGIIKQLGLK